MTNVQVWVAIAMAAVYCVGKAYVWWSSNVENKKESDEWAAESVLVASMHVVCETLYQSYIKATGAITDAQMKDLFTRAESMAKSELDDRGVTLERALTAFQVGRQLRVAYDDFVDKDAMRPIGGELR